MTYLQLFNHINGTVEIIETPLTLREYIAIHWGAWLFYQVIRTGANKYLICDKFSNTYCYTIEKMKKGDIKK